MPKIKIIVTDDNGRLLKEKESELNLGEGRFDDIEREMLLYQQQVMKEVTSDLLDAQQQDFLANKKKRPSSRTAPKK